MMPPKLVITVSAGISLMQGVFRKYAYFLNFELHEIQKTFINEISK